MNETCKSAFDNGVATVGSQIGYSGDGPFAMDENIQSSQEPITAEDIVGDQGTGVELNIPEGNTVEAPPNGGKGWLIVLAVAILLSFSSVQTSLQPKTLAFFGKAKPSSEGNGQRFSNLEPLEVKLDQLLDVFLTTGDESLVLNISLILHQLNKTHLIESIIMEKQEEMMKKREEMMAEKSATVAVTNANVEKVSTIQKVLFSLFGVVSSTLILMIGYRWATLIGSVLLGVGCLGAAFCDNSNLHLVTFLYGALPGIGQNLVTVSCTVAVIEYFKSRRLIALIIPILFDIIINRSRVLDVVLFLFQSVGINDWKSYLLFQTSIAGVMVPFSLFLRPLHLRMKDDSDETLVSRIFGVDGLKIYKSPVLYTFGFVWFFWEGGFSFFGKTCCISEYAQGIPPECPEHSARLPWAFHQNDLSNVLGYTIVQTKLSSFMPIDIIPFFTLGTLLVLFLAIASLIGTCISCCISCCGTPCCKPCCVSKSISLKTSIIIITFQCATAAILNFLASQLYNFIYALHFSGILGLLKGLTAPFLQYSIPLVVGEENLVIGTGIVTMGQGLGALTMTVAADEIQKRTGSIDECFYLAGALFLVGSCCTVFCYHLFHRNKVEISGHGPNIENA